MPAVSNTTQLAENLWIVDGPAVRWVTVPFPTRMTIVRLADGELLIHSPIELTPDVKKTVKALGTPKYLITPNKIHHLFWSQWQACYPNTLSFAPPGLTRKRPDLSFAGELGDSPEPFWTNEVDQLIFKGSRVLDEVVFFHRPSGTLILGDLLENFDPGTLSSFHRLLARLGRVLAPHGETPLDYRQTFMLRHREARESLRRMLEWKPRSVVMCHGLPVYEDAAAFLEAGFGWISPRHSP
ncbi:conserved hypothetical protein [gamma proteobacterium NOR5-3]|nr:conserved hypothetical protein [gamma proteobacterium NOR5-3]